MIREPLSADMDLDRPLVLALYRSTRVVIVVRCSVRARGGRGAGLRCFRQGRIQGGSWTPGGPWTPPSVQDRV